MTKTETIKQILKLTKKEKSSEVFDKLSDMNETYLTKLFKVIKGL